MNQAVKQAFNTKVDNYIQYLKTTDNLIISVVYENELKVKIIYENRYGNIKSKILEKILPQ